MKEPSSSRPYYAQLDGLRGVAILMVLIYHLFPNIPFSTWGRLGVDLFFVLSGFLISDGLLHSLPNRHFRRIFYAKRAFRILPLYFLMLFCIYILCQLEPSMQIQGTYLQQNQIFFLFQLQNWLLMLHPLPGQKLIFAHLWSIGFEEQFYILWPLVLPLLIKSRIPLFVMLFSIILLWALRFSIGLNEPASDQTYLLLYLGRPDGLFIGSFLAILRQKENVGFIVKRLLQLLAISTFLEAIAFALQKNVQFPISHYFVFGHTVAAIVFAFLLLLALDDNNKIIKQSLSNPQLKYLGKISYGLYLFHWPILVIIGKGKMADWMRSLSASTATTILGVVCFVLAVSLSTISYLSIEQFFIKRRQSISRLLLK